MTKKYKKIFSILGILAPLYFFLLINLLSLFWPDYNFNSEYVSNLGSVESPVRAVMNIFGFALFGLILVGIGVHMKDEVKDGFFSVMGSRLLIFSGLVVVLLGVFPVDRDSLVVTSDGVVHRVLSGLIFVLAPISIIFSGLAFRKDDHWNQFWIILSFVLAIIALVALFFMEVYHHSPYAGLIERLGIGAVLLWIFLVSVHSFFNDLLSERNI